MNQASAWRVELAREIAGVYAANSNARMSALGGSAARGLADAFSDLDIAVYWQRIDDDWLEHAPLAASGADRFTFRKLFGGQVAVEQYFVGDAKVDVAHFALEWWEQVVAGVTERAEMDDEKQEVLDGFLSAIPFHGLTEYERWRGRIAAYPDELGRAMVRRHLAFYPPWVLEQHGLARGDLPSFYGFLGEMVMHLLGVLAGLNHIYVSLEKPKRSADLLRRMWIAPHDAAERVQALFAGERERAPGELAALIAETLDLVNRHMPEVDTSRARAMQRIEARPCLAKPAFPFS